MFHGSTVRVKRKRRNVMSRAARASKTWGIGDDSILPENSVKSRENFGLVVSEEIMKLSL